MGIVNIVTDFLAQHKIPYATIDNPGTGAAHADWITTAISVNSLATIALLQDSQGSIIALYPANKHLNLAAINSILKRPLRFLDISELSALTVQCENNNFTKILAEKNFQIIIDDELCDMDQIHFEAMQADKYIQLETTDLQPVLDNLPIGCHFSEPRAEFNSQVELSSGRPRLDISNKIKKIENLPMLPSMATELLLLQNNPNSTVENLAAIVDRDPPLAAQIIRYSNSALFGQSSRVQSLYDAIFRILGFDTVLYLALGLAMGNTFKLHKNGPIGSTRIWQHATYCAAICQALSEKIPNEFRPAAGKAYLAGLLHDIGYLVLAHSFSSEYFWLNKLIASKPDIPANVIEQQLLGVCHTDLGLALMENWNMPEFLKIAVFQHHNENYLQQHCEIAGLVLIADRVLKSKDMSDSFSDRLPFDLLHKLGLNEEIVNKTVDKVFESSESLDVMVKSMSA